MPRKPQKLTPTAIKIREWREKHNLTREDAAAIVDRTARAWEAWEIGYRNPEPNIFKLLTMWEQTQKEAAEFREWRKSLGLTKKDAAKIAGVHVRVWCNFETGHKKPNQMIIKAVEAWEQNNREKKKKSD